MTTWSLRTKLTTWSATVAGFFVVVCGAGSLLFIEHEQLQSLDDRLQAEARTFFREMRLHGKVVDWTQRIQVGEVLATADESRYVQIVDAAGRTVYKSPNLGDGVLTGPLQPARTLQVAGRRVRVRGFQEEPMTLFLGADLDEIDAATRQLAVALLAALPLLLAFAALGGWWLARTALAPIRAITAATEDITADRLNQRLPFPITGGEIGRLGIVLNEAFDRIDKSFRQAVRFSADASHELKTPLTILRTSIEDLLESDSLSEAHRDAVAALLEQTTRLSSITQSLLLLSRADAGHLKLDLKETDVAELITACVDDAMVMAESREITVDASIPPHMHASVDGARLVQALLNLLDNALKYNRHGGRVHLHAERLADDISITVENTGPGISAEHAPHLFERFYRGPSNSDVPGQGLGLSLARELARAHEGDVVLLRSEPDCTVFQMRIRSAFIAPAGVHPAPHTAPALPDSSSRSIFDFPFRFGLSTERCGALKEIVKILSYLAGTILLAALLAPPLFRAGRALAVHGYFTFLAKVDFHSYFDRAILFSAVVLLFPLARSLQIRDTASLGLLPNPRWRQDLVVGLVVAILSSILLTVCAAHLQAWRLRDWSRLLRLLSALMPAIVVPCIEEPLFRGAMQGVVARSASKRTALVFVAVLFAVVHFLTKPEHPIPAASVSWASGFSIIPLMLWKFQHPAILLGGLSAMLIIGLILGYARMVTASLWLPLGLHAGWILGRALGGLGWRSIEQRPANTAPWFGADPVDGLCPVLILLLAGAAIWWWSRERRGRGHGLSAAVVERPSAGKPKSVSLVEESASSPFRSVRSLSDRTPYQPIPSPEREAPGRPPRRRDRP